MRSIRKTKYVLACIACMALVGAAVTSCENDDLFDLDNTDYSASTIHTRAGIDMYN